jgi:energy-coupling factor transporter ATP-binding protein EcfA2
MPAPIETKAVQGPPAILPKWANDQDGWCRTIAADVLKSRMAPAQTDIDLYLKLLLSEKKLSADTFETVPKIEEKQFDKSPLEAVRLDAIKLGDGINALKAGAEIDFASGVTVIFGENGSGKSGFVRVLKRVAGVRTAEDILHNVRTGKRPTPTATFTVTTGSASRSVKWNNEFGITPLNRISIFDARGASFHVEDDLTYVYTPGELTLFPLVQNAIERVRTALEGAILSRVPAANTLLMPFDRNWSIYATIETLGAATDLDEIRAYATLPENIDASVDALTLEVDALKTTNIHNDLRRARDRSAVVKTLKAALVTAKAFDPATYASRLQARNTAAQRRDEAGSTAFEGLGIPGVLGPEWRQFIQAGEEYLKKNAASTYPTTKDACAYCQQPLTGSAVALIKKYREFSNNEIKSQLDVAETQLRAHVQAVVALNTGILQQQLEAEINGGTDVLVPLTPVLQTLKELTVNAAARTTIEWKDKDAEIASSLAIVAAEETRLNDLTAGLQTSLNDRQVLLKAKQLELTELNGKKTTNALLPQIEKRVGDAKWVAKAGIIKNNLTSVLRSLTEAAKEASEELLNKDFAKRFEDESVRLRAPNVTLNFPGRQGQVTRRKLVASYKPSQVLSEGEQKALALADFLAEVTSVPASSPVVFDDPITSMDYRRIHEVSDRIIALSEHRQVIVFTHNIWFAAELLAKAEKQNLKYYDIRLEGSEVGVVTAGTHPRVDGAKQIIGKLNQLIDAAQKQTGEVKAALVEKGYEHLRSLCEVIVEQEMFKGVVQRYAPNMMMTKLPQMKLDGFNDTIAVIVPLFEKCCRYIASHSQPIETQGIRPTLDELRADVAAVLKARDPHT